MLFLNIPKPVNKNRLQMLKLYMMKGVIRLLIASAMLLPAVLSATACTPPQGEGFAVYLTADDIPPERMEMLSRVETAADPIIAQDDIVSYRRSTHEIVLKPDAAGRLSETLFPVHGTSFLVCVDGAPLYWGAFWPYYSSLSFDGVVIPVPVLNGDTIRIELGYPGSSFFSGEDPRDNPLVWQALTKAGKLKP